MDLQERLIMCNEEKQRLLIEKVHLERQNRKLKTELLDIRSVISAYGSDVEVSNIVLEQKEEIKTLHSKLQTLQMNYNISKNDTKRLTEALEKIGDIVITNIREEW